MECQGASAAIAAGPSPNGTKRATGNIGTSQKATPSMTLNSFGEKAKRISPIINAHTVRSGMLGTLRDGLDGNSGNA